MKVIKSDMMIQRLPESCREYGDYGVTEAWLKDTYENTRYWQELAEGKK